MLGWGTAAPVEPSFSLGETTQLDWTGRLSLDMIRQHTKTMDIPGTTNELLELYRASAIEAAERYTGLLLAEQRTVTESISGPPRIRPGRWSYKVRLRHPVADGIVYVYGGASVQSNTPFHVTPAARAYPRRP